MTVFRELLRIKEFREGKAETEYIRCRQVAAQASAEVEAGRERLHSYRDWAARHEAGLYADLCKRLVRLRDIDDLYAEVYRLRDGERDLEARLHDAENAKQQAVQAMEQAGEALQQATRQRNKFVELASVYSEEARAELERREEAELEEFRSKDSGWDEDEGEGDVDADIDGT